MRVTSANNGPMPASRSNVESLQTIYPGAICVSAKTGLNIDKIAEVVMAKYKGGDADIIVRCHAGDGRVLSFMRAHTEIKSEEYEDSDVVIKARIGKSQLPGLRKICPDGIEVA